MQRFDAVVFDLDGTLVDTERKGMEAGRDALAELGYDVPLEHMYRLVGRDQASGDALLSEIVGGRISFAELLPRWRIHYEKRFTNGIPLMRGARELLDRLSERGMPRAIATSSRMEPARRKLDRSGLAPLFEVIVTFDCVTNPKPAPEPYLRAADLLRIDPARCLAFEDSDTGAASARAAGMTVVQIPDILPTDGAHAHHIAADLLAGARAAGLIA